MEGELGVEEEVVVEGEFKVGGEVGVTSEAEPLLKDPKRRSLGGCRRLFSRSQLP